MNKIHNPNELMAEVLKKTWPPGTIGEFYSEKLRDFRINQIKVPMKPVEKKANAAVK
uniref:Uncharacterized protein n=1 Tax=viral metagenome TaxID=1070528 RepID=A0A6M3LIU8_9ZZZZ